MPTIDDLPAANSVNDTDELILSQSGNTVKGTRSQVVSGLQAAIYVPQGSLLGRISPGLGAPENITIGANLSVNAGVMTAPAPYVVAQSSPGGPIQPTDLVAVGQGGDNACLPYNAFMSGLSRLAGIDASALEVTASGAPGGRTLSAIASDAISVEAFGAVGDGQTDDTAAFGLALASGRAIRLDAKIYVVNGPLTIGSSSALLGVTQNSVVKRLMAPQSGTWITVTAPAMFACGVIFDAGSLATAPGPALEIAQTCLAASLIQCEFRNGFGSAAGSGLMLQCGPNAAHSVLSCAMSGNTLHGVGATGGGMLTMTGCSSTDNGGCGVSVGNGVGAILRANQCDMNQIGISVGGWNEAPFAISIASPMVVERNTCIANANWGVAIAGSGARVCDNTLSNNGSLGVGGAILARVVASQVAGNMVSGSVTAIDCRASSTSAVTGNFVNAATNGLLAGGSQNLLVQQNTFTSNVWSVQITGIEPSLTNLPTGNVTIDRNWVSLTQTQGAGIYVMDGAQTVSVTGNMINGWGSASVEQALWVHTDSAILRGNTWNNTTRFPISAAIVANLPTLVLPDVADDALVIAAPPNVQSILTMRQLSTMGQVTFIRVTSGGTGYSQAQVTITGSGSGAQAEAILDNGVIVWVITTSPGSGYGAIGAQVSIAIEGNGSGASAQGFVGLPVLEGKRLRLSCNTQLRLVQTGSVPPQTSWSGFDTTIPAMGAVEIEGTYGQWRSLQSPPVDYLLPTGDGGAILQSVAGADVIVRPSSGGLLQIASAAEPAGYVASVGRGSPEGNVAAPPGSDFRNLNGGAGNTFWIKQSGTDNQGWIAVA